MAWERPAGLQALNALRHGVRAALLIVGLILSMLLIYIIFKCSVFFADFLDRTIFSRPWG